jgi:hypothetical protein
MFILYMALKRQPNSGAAAQILKVSDFNSFHLFISASMATDIFYIIRKMKGKTVGLTFLRDLLAIMDVCKVDKSVLLLALESDFGDFEDAVQHFAGVEAEVEVLIARNKKDYAASSLQVFEPDEFVNKYLSAT